MRFTVLGIGLGLAACAGASEDKVPLANYTATDRAVREAGAPIELEPMGRAVLEMHNIYDAGCSIRSIEAEGILFAAFDDRAFFMIDNNVSKLAPYEVEEVLPYGVSDHYHDGDHRVGLKLDRSTEVVIGQETSEYVGGLIIRDTEERVVFEYSGVIECGA